jgi:putative sigma-54 modulation protein
MDISVTSRTHPLSDDLKSYINERLSRLEVHQATDGSGHLVLNQVRHMHTAELVVKADGTVITAHASEDDLRKVVEEVVEKAARQLEKHRERRQER